MMNGAKTPSASTTMKMTRRKMEEDEDEECVPVVGLCGYSLFPSCSRTHTHITRSILQGGNMFISYGSEVDLSSARRH